MKNFWRTNVLDQQIGLTTPAKKMKRWETKIKQTKQKYRLQKLLKLLRWRLLFIQLSTPLNQAQALKDVYWPIKIAKIEKYEKYLKIENSKKNC